MTSSIRETTMSLSFERTQNAYHDGPYLFEGHVFIRYDSPYRSTDVLNFCAIKVFDIDEAIKEAVELFPICSELTSYQIPKIEDFWITKDRRWASVRLVTKTAEARAKAAEEWTGVDEASRSLTARIFRMFGK